MPDMWMDVDAALSEVPVNLMPLLDDTDFKSREESVAYNAAGLELIWHFTTTAGATTATVVTPTTGGAYDWAHQDGGMYTIEIPASGGASINNDTEGFGWFTGVATGILPWRGPMIGFRAAGINNALIDGAWSATRGLGGPTALPDAAADAAGGLPISDAGGLDLDTYIKRLEAAFTSTIAGYIDAAISTRAPETGGALAGLATTVGVAGAGLTGITGAKLHADYDAAKSAASQDSVNDLPTNAELTTALAAADDAVLAAIAALENLSSAGAQAAAAAALTAYGASTYDGTDTAGTTTLLSRLSAVWAAQLDAAISTRLATAGYTAPPSAATVAASVWSAVSRTLTAFGFDVSVTVDDEALAAAVVAAISEEGVVDEAALAAAVVTALGALTITVQSPVASSGTITIYQGDDYVAAEGTSIAVTVAVSGAPDLTGATVHLKLTQATWEATSCTSDGTDWTIVFEPDAADTAALSGGSQLYEVEATLASGSVRTLAKGVCMVEKDIPAV